MTLPLTLLMSPQAYRLDASRPLGRESAGASFLEAYLRFSGNKRHHVVVADRSHAHWFHGEACRYQDQPETVMVGLSEWGTAASATGAVVLPGPGLDEWAWKRMPWSDGAFSLVGLVHTLCSRQVQWGLGQFSTAPIRPWDALICTSTAARAVVTGFLERQEAWLERRLGASCFERPQLPVIPLGIHPEAWTPRGGKAEAQSKARQMLGIPNDALVVLLAGRMDVLTKFHPGPLLRVLADLQEKELTELHLLIYGEAPNQAMGELWRNGLAGTAPKLPVSWIAGHKEELAGAVRWAADVFVSLADNPQETFGITPLEAMAAELPCVVSDWDGYRDTVDEQVGARIPTRMFEGLGIDEAGGLLSETMNYDRAVGRIAQGIAVDVGVLRRTLLSLLRDPIRLRQMGENGRRRVEQEYSWKVVMKQWRAMLEELAEMRQEGRDAMKAYPRGTPPWLPSSSEGFGCFASEVLSLEDQLHWNNNSAMEIADRRLAEPLDSWDEELRRAITSDKKISLDQLSPRAKGWLLKQGLVSTLYEA